VNPYSFTRFRELPFDQGLSPEFLPHIRTHAQVVSLVETLAVTAFCCKA
jgi:hypothetical protein